MSNKYILLLLPLLLTFASCQPTVEEVELPTWISTDVIPSHIRTQIQRYMPIYEGNTPPVISGCYVASQIALVYTSDGSINPGFVTAEMFYRFGPQQFGQITNYKERQGTTEHTSSDLRVVGYGNHFSAYYIAEGWQDLGTTADDPTPDGYYESYSKYSVVLSGIMSPQGIRNFYYAFISLDKIDPWDKMADVNTYRIYTDADSLAENVPVWQFPERR